MKLEDFWEKNQWKSESGGTVAEIELSDLTPETGK